MDLTLLRDSLADIDERMVNLIAERQRVVSEIAKVKQASGRATRDFEQEKQVLQRVSSLADGLNVSAALVQDIMRALIRHSLAHQERSRVIAEGQGTDRRALVIGGAGKMGQWFVDFFGSQGFLTVVADPDVTPAPGFCRDWRQAGTDYDVIVVAAPMITSGEILSELATLQPKGLIFDIGSLKSPLKQGLQDLKQAGCKVASLHPMFGPSTELLSGRHLIFVDAGCPEATREAKQLFSATMAEQLDMSVDDHDRLIAYVLGLSHALNIAFFTALADSGEAAPALADISSTTFDAQLLVSQAVAAENPHMYFEIQHLNAFGQEPLRALQTAVEKISGIVAEGDEAAFVELMQQGRSYLSHRQMEQ